MTIVGLGNLTLLASQAFDVVPMESREDRMVRELWEYRHWKREFQSKFTRNSLNIRNYNKQYRYRIDYKWERLTWLEKFQGIQAIKRRYSSTLKLN